MMKLAIKPNNFGTGKDSCAICGRSMDTRTPYELFALETWRPVCRECGERHAPILVKLLDYLYSSEELQKEASGM